MKSYDEIYQNVLRRRDEQLAKKRRRIAVAGSVVLPAVMLTAAAGIGIAAWQSGVAYENPLAAESGYEGLDIEVTDGRAVVSRCALGGYTAELELTDITEAPTAESNYYCTNSISVRVTDPDGRAAEAVLSYNTDPDKWLAEDMPGVEMNGDGENRPWQQFLVRLPADRIGESLKLYELDDNGTKHYVLALRKYFEEDPYIDGAYFYSTMFFSCEEDSFDSGVLSPNTIYTLPDDDEESGFEAYPYSYEAVTTDDMRVSGMSIINDGAIDLRSWAADVYTFDPASGSFTYEQVPQIGGDAIVSGVEMNGFEAYLRLKGLTHVPDGEENYYTAEEAVVTVLDLYGNKASYTINETSGNAYFTGDNITWKTNDGVYVNGGLHFHQMEYGGEPYYILSLCIDEGDFADVDGSNLRPLYYTMFFDCGAEAGRLTDGLLPAYDGHNHDGEISVLNTSHPLDIKLLYGTTFMDSAYNMQITFDPAGRTYWFGPEYLFPVWDSMGGYTACLELKDVVTRVVDEYGNKEYSYSDAVITVIRSDGYHADLSLSELSGNDYIADIIDKAVNGGHPETALKLLEMDSKGEKHIVLMLRGYHGENNKPYYRAAFFEFDPERRTLTLYTTDNDRCFITTSPHVQIESKDGADVLVTETWDFNDIDNVNDWDYGAACCNSMVKFDHENHIVLWSPITRDSIE